jgi:hypothetical protein
MWVYRVAGRHFAAAVCGSFPAARIRVGPRFVMEFLGRSRIGITMDVYSHVVPSLMRDATDKMDQILTGEGQLTACSDAVADNSALR